jgi:CspA family cold shock protein
MRGTIKKVSERGDYAFINPDEPGAGIFVHVDDLASAGLDAELRVGDRLEFEVTQTAKGPRATNLREAR